jgi:uncharacterized membrane protein YuzA (DUF378 family)
MKVFNLVTLMLTIVGGLVLGAMGVLHFDLFTTLFGSDSLLTKLADLIIGLSALYQIYPLVKAIETNEVHAEVAHR